MPKFYIRGRAYSSNEIEHLTQDSFTLQKIQTMPQRLYKYFPNTIDSNNGRNYSLEALENNTVFLQHPSLFDDPYDCTILVDEQEFARHRLSYYARLCGVKVSPEWDYSKIGYEFACYLYQGLKTGKTLYELFPKSLHHDDLFEKQTEVFVLALQVGLNEFQSSEDLWSQVFYKVIHQEYIDLHRNLIQKFRVACFTESPYSMLMWAHYANNHKGFCIEYDIPPYTKEHQQIYHNLMPVIYSDERISILEQCICSLQQPGLTATILWDVYKYGLLMKSTEWKYQNEWRLISYDNLLAIDYNCKFFKIKKIYLGNKMDVKTRLSIIKRCNQKGIPCAGITIAPNKYEMMNCAQLCETCPRLFYKQ